MGSFWCKITNFSKAGNLIFGWSKKNIKKLQEYMMIDEWMNVIDVDWWSGQGSKDFLKLRLLPFGWNWTSHASMRFRQALFPSRRLWSSFVHGLFWNSSRFAEAILQPYILTSSDQTAADQSRTVLIGPEKLQRRGSQRAQAEECASRGRLSLGKRLLMRLKTEGQEKPKLSFSELPNKLWLNFEYVFNITRTI